MGEGKTANPSRNIEGRTKEWSTGARVFLDFGSIQPFFSGGLVHIQTEVESQSSISVSQGTGVWGESGGIWEPFSSLHVGGALKYSYANVGKAANGGGLHLVLVTGWQW